MHGSLTFHALAAMLILTGSALGQTKSARQKPKPSAKAGAMPRTPDGKPDFQGVWETHNVAVKDIEDRLGKGIIVTPEDGKIPYLPAAAQERDTLRAHQKDPAADCALPGVPRQMYAPAAFQILEPPGSVVILFETSHAYRVIPTDGRPHLPTDIKLNEGDSRGHWEGDTLVVDVTNQNDKTWFDMAGNFHSDAIHVIERFTPAGANTINYEATIEDPKTYTRPWKIAFPIIRVTKPGYEITERACGK
jgi:hypothetical protein